MGWITDIYEFEGDKTQKGESYRYRHRVSLNEGKVKLACGRVYFKSALRTAYWASVKNQQDVISRNNAKLAEGVVGGGPPGYGFAQYPIAGDPLETVPTVAAYAGDDELTFRFFAGWEDEYLTDQATQYDLNGGAGSMASITQPVTPKNVILTLSTTAVTAISITVTGVLPNGDTETETFTETTHPLSANGTIEGQVAYRSITSVEVDSIDGEQAGDTLDLGYGTLRYSREIYSRDPFKIPSNLRHNRFMVEVEGNVDVQLIEAASSIRELMAGNTIFSTRAQ